MQNLSGFEFVLNRNLIYMSCPLLLGEIPVFGIFVMNDFNDAPFVLKFELKCFLKKLKKMQMSSHAFFFTVNHNNNLQLSAFLSRNMYSFATPSHDCQLNTKPTGSIGSIPASIQKLAELKCQCIA